MKALLFRSAGADGLSDVARAVFKRILKLDVEFCFDPHNLNENNAIPAISQAEQVKAPVGRSTDGSRWRFSKGREGRGDGQMGTVT